MPYNPEIHHRRSIRLKGYDYSQAGSYFVTICVQNRECVFGKIEQGKIHLSPLGIIADILWYEIKNHAKNTDLGAFTVMPNHIHGIIMLLGVGEVEAGHARPLPPQHPPPPQQSRFQNQGKNTLSSIVGSYKSAVSKHAHRLGFAFSWQRNYYEHIIRNEQSYQNIPVDVLLGYRFLTKYDVFLDLDNKILYIEK
jgi:REP element-mobilizing transposase RayT